MWHLHFARLEEHGPVRRGCRRVPLPSRADNRTESEQMKTRRFTIVAMCGLMGWALLQRQSAEPLPGSLWALAGDATARDLPHEPPQAARGKLSRLRDGTGLRTRPSPARVFMSGIAPPSTASEPSDGLWVDAGAEPPMDTAEADFLAARHSTEPHDPDATREMHQHLDGAATAIGVKVSDLETACSPTVCRVAGGFVSDEDARRFLEIARREGDSVGFGDLALEEGRVRFLAYVGLPEQRPYERGR